MGSAREFLFDVALVALTVSLARQLVVSALRYRQGERSAFVRWEGVAALAASVVVLVAWGDSLADVLSGRRWVAYPPQPAIVLWGVFLAASVAAIALVDAATRWVAWIEDRIRARSQPVPRPRGWSEAIVVSVGIVAAFVALVVIEPPWVTGVSPRTAPPEVITMEGLPRPIGSGSRPEAATEPPPPSLTLTPLTGAGGLRDPIVALAVPDTDVLYVAERAGGLRIVDLAADGTVSTLVESLVGDVSAEVDSGMLGLALHPEFATNGRLFVFYRSVELIDVLAEVVVEGPASSPDSVTVRGEILRIPHPYGLHQGGQIAFGPDGLLYVGVGDGGEPWLASDLDDLRGSILRLDVDGAAPYAIPAANAFGGSAATEIWAHGLRNPYRFWFDEPTGLLHVGDVGESFAEEISVVSLDTAGLDFGWPTVEGHGCTMWEYPAFTFGGCDRSSSVDPVLVYGHIPDCAIVLGPVYRGAAMPHLEGRGFFADFCNSWIRAYRLDGERVNDVLGWAPSGFTRPPGAYLSFGLDHDGEILLLTTDRIYRLGPAA